VICNPRGYFARELNRDFNPGLVIEIGESPGAGDARRRTLPYRKSPRWPPKPGDDE
jgi:hypothetical protein